MSADARRRPRAICRNGTWPTSIPAATAPELTRDLAAARRRRPRRSARARRASSPALPGAELGAAVAAYERLQETLGRRHQLCRAGLCRRHDRPEIGRFFQTMQERINDDRDRAAVLHPRAQPHRGCRSRREARRRRRWRITRPWLRDVRAFRPHQLSRRAREAAAREIGGRARRLDPAVRRDRSPRCAFRVGGKELTSAEALNLLSDRDGAMRKAAAKALGKVLGAATRGSSR